ncbi:MAG: cache domain-containing protein [Methanocorpusculum sp.]|nr:cache domain-containing protein [Methanocorpusculum sp.]
MVIVVLLIVFLAVFVLLTQDMSPPDLSGDNVSSLDSVLEMLNASTDNHVRALETEMSAAAANISLLSSDDPEIASVLRPIYTGNSYVIDIIYVDSAGIVRSAVPDVKNAYVGSDISQWTDFLEARTFSATSIIPLKSNNTRAICMFCPVFSANGSYDGYISASVDPIAFFGPAAYEIEQKTGVKSWVIDATNTTLYNTDHDQVDKKIQPELFHDTRLAESFLEILTNDSGTNVYTYADTHGSVLLLNRTAMWISYPVGSMTWKIGVTSGSSVSHSVVGPALLDDIPLTSFVSNALLYIHEHGDEEALAEFNNPEGVFSQGSRYIYAYSMNGTVLSLPYQPTLVGQNRYQIRDDYGVLYLQSAIHTAQRGGGYVYFLYPNPANNFTKELKIGYVLRVDDDWFIGSGDYVPEMMTAFDPTVVDGLVTDVRKAEEYAATVGKDAALAAFNRANSDFFQTADYVFAGDMEGNVLAFSQDPSTVGMNRLGVTDVYDVSYIRDSITLARNGGGSMYLMLENPVTGKNELHLVYVSPVDDTWSIGAGSIIS